MKVAFFRFRLTAGGLVTIAFKQPAQIARHFVHEAGPDAANIDEAVALTRGQQ
ncbi:hypothetical protein [Mesorhizobium sp.]|uniref:hypothetical protein n=1 Tax=Mesorhizobium sp. TaxID=1871066 RepID=UPI00345D271C